MIKWQILSVALGGAAGALLRWAINIASARLSTSTFPIATLTANILGCFCIGLAYVYLVDRAANPILRLGIITGLLGALTTFSTFSLDALALWQNGHFALSAVYILSNVALCLIAMLAAILLTRLI